LARVRTLCGPYRSRRSAEIDARLVEQWGRAVLLVPTRAAANARLEAILSSSGLAGAIDRPVQTFEDFVLRVIHSVERAPRILSDFERELLLADAIKRHAGAETFSALGEGAATRGFRTHILRVITQLKQAAIDPPAFWQALLRRKSKSWLDEAVASIYEGYHNALLITGAFDRVGLFWAAHELCQDAKPQTISDIDALFLDGFDDFTPSEFRFLQTLGRHFDSITFGLNADVESASRSDLYAIPRKTLQDIHRYFDDVQDTVYPAAPVSSTIHLLAAELYWRDRPTLPVDIKGNVELSPCHDPQHEIEFVARRVKTDLLSEETAFQRIAVVYRSTSGVADLVRAVFAECGIPVRFTRGRDFASCAVISAFMHYLDAMTSWEHETVCETLASRWLDSATASPELLHAIPILTRAAGRFNTRAEWHDGIGRLKNRIEKGLGDDATYLRDNLPGVSQLLESLAHRFNAFASAFDAIPDSATLSRYAEAFDVLFSRVVIENADFPNHHDLDHSEHVAAFASMRELFATMCAADRMLENSPKLTRAEFVEVLKDAIQHQTIPVYRAANAVTCCDAESVRGLTFDHVFLCGMNEGTFPAPPQTSAIYQSEDIRDFADAGLFLDDKRRNYEREALLFHHVIESAQETLTITWHTLSSDGRAKLESPFIADVRELLPASPIIRPASKHWAMPEPDGIASERELCNLIFADDELREQEGTKRYPHIYESARIEAVRQFGKGFDSYDGVIASTQLRESISKEFGNDHAFSVTQLETYAKCPFNFFMERVLSLHDVPAATGEFDPLVRGSILHDALRRFYSEFRGKTMAEIDRVAAEATMRRCLDEALNESSWRSPGAPRGLVEAERRGLHRRLQRFLTIEFGKAKSDWRPAWFEVSFGRELRESSEKLSTASHYAYETECGPVKFSGQIDRIDESPAGVRIVDYKSSIAVRNADIEAGVVLQLPLYARAVEDLLLKGKPCTSAILIPIGRNDEKETLGFRGVSREELDDIVCSSVVRCIRGIRSGVFSPTPYSETCFGCGNHKPCRHEPARIERKLDFVHETD
jgi:ATP-dependent helicase/nuclease subunit B